jgi:hypothetical protein
LAKARPSAKVQADAALDLIRTAAQVGKSPGKSQQLDLQG